MSFGTESTGKEEKSIGGRGWPGSEELALEVARKGCR